MTDPQTLQAVREAMEAAIDTLHFETVPYENYQPQLGEERWQKLAAAKSNLLSALSLLTTPQAAQEEVVEREVFIEQVYEALRSGRIRDLDTNWRMANKVLPRDFLPWRKQDEAEITASYRKIHLSDVLQAARDIISHYHRRAALQPTAKEGV